jgi:hypothetical protein
MSDPTTPETTTEDLRHLIGAPPSDPPLVSPSEFSPEMARTARPTWTLPIPKLMLIGAILVPVFALAALFLLGRGPTKSPENQPQTTSFVPPASPAQPPQEELEQLRQENAQLKAKSALEGQQRLQDHPTRTTGQTPTTTKMVTRHPTPATRPAPVSVADPPPAPPRIMSHPSPAPRTIRVPPAPSPAAQLTRLPATAPAPRPEEVMKQWQALAQLGSYGSNASSSGGSAERSPSWRRTAATTTTAGLASAALPASAAIAAPESFANEPAEWIPPSADSSSASLSPAVPTVEVAATSAIPSTSRAGEDVVWISHADGSNSSEPLLVTERTDAAEPESPDVQIVRVSERATPPVPVAILSEAEAVILNDRAQPQSLIAGSRSAGVLGTPVVVEDLQEQDSPEKVSRDRFVVLLSTPLEDAQGQIALPAGSQILVQVDELSPAGRVQLSATRVAWDEAGRQKELVLPPAAIQVRGRNGEPLIASHFEDRGGEMAAMDMGQFALGAVHRSAQLFTRSNTRVQTGDGTTVVTESNPSPNLLAGALEGGTEALFETIRDRNQKAVEAIQSRPQIRFIQAGTPVEVFVNQSMRMPM